MKEEVETGVRFISRLVNQHNKLAKRQVKRFGESLVTVLCERFDDHWYPENPLKGQAYSAIPLKMPATAAGETSGTTLPRPRPYNPEDPLQPMFSGRESLRQYKEKNLKCIRINRWQKVDDSLLKACKACDLDYSELALPREISIWIDPGEVCCRLGENNHYFKVNDEKRSSGKASPELQTSDYHSESPSECSSEDEGPTKAPKATPAPSKNHAGGSNAAKQATQYFYMPSPLWVPCPQPLVSYIPAYQPMTVYYMASKSPVPRKPNPNLVKRLTNRASKA